MSAHPIGKVTSNGWAWGVAWTCFSLLCLTLTLPLLSSPSHAKDRPGIRVVIDDNYPPYIFRNLAGDLEGYLVDIWKLWENKTGVRVELQAMDWASAQKLITSGQADVIDTIFQTPARDLLYDFTAPYADIPVSIFAHDDIGGIIDPTSLRGFQVGVKAGDACIDRLRESGVTTLEPFSSYQLLVDATASGHVKVFCLDDPPANYLLYRAGLHQSFRHAFTLYSGQFHRAVRKGDAATLALVNKGFADITPSEQQKLLDTWLGRPLDSLHLARYLGFGVVTVSVLGGGIGIWVIVLRREVRRRTRELNDERTRLRTLLDTMPDMVWLKDPKGVYLAANAGLVRLFGSPESLIVGRTDYDFVPRALADLFRRKDLEAIAIGGPNTNIEDVTVAADGTRLTVETTKTPMYDAAGQLVGVLGIGRDITLRIRQEERLRLAARVFESTAEAIVIAEPSGRIVAVNRAFLEITGYAEDEALGQDVHVFLWADGDNAEAIRTALETAGSWQGETWSWRRNGERFAQWQTVSVVRDEAATVTHRVIVFSDITSVKRSQEALDFLAHHDSLTGLPNRAYLLDRLRWTLQRAITGDDTIALLFIDLDGFKHVNDSLGHPVGDQLLCVAANRMQGHLGPLCTLARLGGDEYVAILETTDASEAASTAHDINALFVEPALVGGRELYITASIGIALFPDDGDEAESLLQHADLAMSRAKGQGRNTFRFYEAAMGEAANQRMAIASALRVALQRNELYLVYQPQAQLPGEQLVGVEALLRWRHPDFGLVPPDQFIPVAEENGTILEIGAWVLEQACRQMASWREQGFIVPRMAVNLSIQQIEHGHLIFLVKDVVQKYDLSPESLELEITESMAMRQESWVADTLEELNCYGVQLAIDDFGTGHSSLGRLKQLPMHRLKIDRSFIRDIGSDPNDEAIVRAIITLGHVLDLKVVAEGVELPEQAHFLELAGCDAAQGYLYARPMDPDALMAAWRPHEIGTQSPLNQG